MPTPALSIVNLFWNEQKKVDFYRQSDGKMISFEAKLDLEDHQYSIEFDSTGSLIDVEELSEALQNTITEKIDKQYTRFKFTQIQR
jgi:hypothetical protein